MDSLFYLFISPPSFLLLLELLERNRVIGFVSNGHQARDPTTTTTTTTDFFSSP
jgi:hypothetical protein